MTTRPMIRLAGPLLTGLLSTSCSSGLATVDPAPLSATPTPAASAPTETSRLFSYGSRDGAEVMTVTQHCAGLGEAACFYTWELFPPGATAPTDTGELEAVDRTNGPQVIPGSNGYAFKAWSQPVITVVTDESTTRGGIVFARTGTNTWDKIRIDGGSARPLQLTSQAQTIGEVQRSGGRLWMMEGDHPVRVAWRVAQRWHRHTISDEPSSLAGYLAVDGDRAAALASADGGTVLPVGTLAITVDGGQSWIELRRADVPFQDVSSLAAADDTLFVTEQSGKVWRSDGESWTVFTRVPNLKADNVETAGDKVIAHYGAEPVSGRLAFIAADGEVERLPIP